MNTIPELIDRWNAVEGKVTLAVYWSELNLPPAVPFSQKSMTFAAYKKLCATHGAKNQAAWLPRVPKQGYASVLVGLQGFAFAFVISRESTTAGVDEVVQLCEECAKLTGMVHSFRLVDNWLLACRGPRDRGQKGDHELENQRDYDLIDKSIFRLNREAVRKPSTWRERWAGIDTFPYDLPQSLDGVREWLEDSKSILEQTTDRDGDSLQFAIARDRLDNAGFWLRWMGHSSFPEAECYERNGLLLDGITRLIAWIDAEKSGQKPDTPGRTPKKNRQSFPTARQNVEAVKRMKAEMKKRPEDRLTAAEIARAIQDRYPNSKGARADIVERTLRRYRHLWDPDKAGTTPDT
ncbi:MAG: hypothetical protein R3E01_02660 [Pirellulaceae bacterium]